LGLVAGLDWRHPAVKIPAVGRVGLDSLATLAAAAMGGGTMKAEAEQNRQPEP
jgi:hypothetical protein